jgi:glycosyltransferase involved in cell wall biosynthesis
LAQRPGNDARLSVIISVFNEEPTVAELVERVRAVPLTVEIVAVDDASTDGSRAILDRPGAEQRSDQVIHQRVNRGNT